MAYYSTTVETPWDADRAFDYMADLRNFERWDPGIQSSDLVEGSDPGVGSAYDLKVSGTNLRYETLEFDRPRRTVVEANSSLLRSYDVIEVTPSGSGATVSYEATLELKGILQFADPILGLVFNRIGDKAAAGMAKALESAKVR